MNPVFVSEILIKYCHYSLKSGHSNAQNAVHFTGLMSMLRCENRPISEKGDAHPNFSSRTEPTLPVNNVLCK